MKFISYALGVLLMLSGSIFSAEKVIVKNGMKLELPDRKIEITIEPLKLYTATGQKSKISEIKPAWNTGVYLGKAAWVFKTVIPGSVKISLDGEVFKENEDYAVNYNWGTVGKVKGSKMPAGKLFSIDYKYTLARVDLVEVSAAGKVLVKKGEEHRTRPLTPEADTGATPLFAVYLGQSTLELSDKNILMIETGVTSETPVFGAENLAKIKKLIKDGGTANIVCFGDSITAGKDADWYVGRLSAYYKDKDKIKVINSGVGGDTTRGALKRLDAAVLDLKPDLVVIMFGVNDENAAPGGKNGVPPAEYRNNLKQMVETIRTKSGSDVILMTTSWKNLGWEATKGNLNEYADCVRSLGKEMNLCVVDNFRAWANLEKRGIPYMRYLDSCINHPSGEAHEVFFNGIKSALEK